LTHQFNPKWIAELPFGKGRRFAPDAGRALNALIGGWRPLDLGFPIRIDVGQNWPPPTGNSPAWRR
jgi:hypothetical protein